MQPTGYGRPARLLQRAARPLVIVPKGNVRFNQEVPLDAKQVMIILPAIVIQKTVNIDQMLMELNHLQATVCIE